jgi:Tetratricopeptide repeat
VSKAKREVQEKSTVTRSGAYISALSRLAAAYAKDDRDKTAEATYRECIRLTEEFVGPDFFQLSVLLHNLADLIMAHSRYAEATELLGRAVAIAEGYYGPGTEQVEFLKRKLRTAERRRTGRPRRPAS